MSGLCGVFSAGLLCASAVQAASIRTLLAPLCLRGDGRGGPGGGLRIP